MFTEWQHKFVAERPAPADGSGVRFKVTAGLHYIRGNRRPYFSVTGELYRPGARDIDAGGMMHEHVMRYFPELNPVISMHLCDDTGEPMHSAGNGWYFLAGYYGGAGEAYHAGNDSSKLTPDECLKMFAGHVRISLDDARKLADEWAKGHNGKLVPAWTRDRMEAWIETQRERWQMEADTAVACLEAAIQHAK